TNRNRGTHWKPHADTPFFDSFLFTKTTMPTLPTKKKKNEPADPCSHWYPGHRAFEAPEVNTVGNYITKVNGIGKGAGKEGPGGKATPYSYKCDKLPKDVEDQMEALFGAAQAGRRVYGTGFATGTLCELLYRAPGNLFDYVYSAASIKYSYAAFLRDTRTLSFSAFSGFSFLNFPSFFLFTLRSFWRFPSYCCLLFRLSPSCWGDLF
ncbi:hypothetical protein B0H11DRAFT_2025476, partial [Mycena galericulata]